MKYFNSQCKLDNIEVENNLKIINRIRTKKTEQMRNMLFYDIANKTTHKYAVMQKNAPFLFSLNLCQTTFYLDD